MTPEGPLAATVTGSKQTEDNEPEALVCPSLDPTGAKALAASLFGLHALGEPRNLG